MLRAFPLFLIPLAGYNLLMLSGDVSADLGMQLWSLQLISGAQWSFSLAELFVAGGVLILYLEIFKSTRTGLASVLDHTLSTLVFVAFLVEFLTMPECGTSTFFVVGLMALMDVIAGFTVSIVAARRDFGFGGDR